MKKVFFLILLGLSLIGILVLGYGIINTSVSLKYETNYSTECISLITGKDLCLTIKVLQTLLVICILIITTLLILKKRIFEK